MVIVAKLPGLHGSCSALNWIRKVCEYYNSSSKINFRGCVCSHVEFIEHLIQQFRASYCAVRSGLLLFWRRILLWQNFSIELGERRSLECTVKRIYSGNTFFGCTFPLKSILLFWFYMRRLCVCKRSCQ